MSDALAQQQFTALTPDDETERLAALQRYNVLDTPPEAAFDRITRLAARLFDVPTALISLVDESRAWFKSCVGFGASEVPRDNTLCSFAVLTNEPLIVPDARLDDRFACNPFVQSEPGVRFYAGAPLLSHDGFNLGTLCLLDSQPRAPLTTEQQATLVDLAAMVVDELELRLAAHRIAQVDAALRSITQSVATVTGEAFLDALVQHFATVLDVDYAYIGLVEGEHPRMLRTIATCAHGQIVENLEYPLQDTPCGDVIQQRKICCYPRNVQAYFPNAPLLKPFSIESYVAIPFFDSSSAALGLLGVMNSKPLESVDLAEALLTVFAGRIVTELERQQTEAALQKSEEQSRNILESINDGFLALDKNWRFTYVNQAAERLTHRTAAELLGKNFWEEFPGAVGNEFEQLHHRAMYDHVAGSITAFYPDHDRWYVVHSYPAAQGITVYFQNVTEQRQAEAALRESENRLRLALESAALGTWDFNPITDVLQWDEQCKAMFGLSPTAEINYEIFLAGLHPQDRDYTHQVVQSSLNPKSGGEYRIEYRTIGIEDGVERWIAAKGKAFFNPAGIAIRFIGTVLNITHVKQAEAEREQLLQREQAARAEAERANLIKDEFLAVLSHELRSPLNPILGWTRLLQTGKLDETRQREALATIERNAKLQTQLIEDLLDISRIMQGKLSLTVAPVSLTFVIEAAAETVRLAAEARNIQILIDLTLESVSVTGDVARLQQVVWNLLTNAVKFTPTNGQVTIELRQFNHLAQIRVMDTGKGINPQFLPHVFEYFRQADATTTRKFGGLGLGLAIVRQIVEMHGGTVWAESEGENRGATFTVQLPVNLQRQLSEPELPRASFATEALLNNLQILLVDDEPDARELQAFLLEQNGARVTAVASGSEALQSLDRAIPDVLVSDIGMADMDGYMLIQQIRSRPGDRGGMVPAIALTAYAREFDQQKALQSGFQAHVVKPVELELLVEEIAKLLKTN